MLSYLLKKIIILLLSLFVVATLTFFLMHAIPGDPFTQEQAIPEEILKAMYRHYGLDQPLYLQYGKYLKSLLSGDLGPSFKYEGQTVNAIIKQAFPVSFALGLGALLIAISAGVVGGTIASLYRGRWQDNLILFLSVAGISLPNFILATFLQYIFAIKLDLLPIARWGSFSQAILPTISLALFPFASITRLTRSRMIEVLQQDYILTAYSKGISTFQIIRNHALRNALLPVLTYLGPLSARILMGSFVIEKIYGIPGLGEWFVMSVSNRDYTLTMGLTIFYSALLMLSVLVVDLFYSLLDPRIKFG